MSYRRHMEDYLKESREERFAARESLPGIEVWPDDDDAMWLLRHENPERDVICSTPEFGDSPFCGTGYH
jgi:hypothetical protein